MIMEEPIEETYFNWLCAKVRENSGPNHISLFQIMHETDFTWTEFGDSHREADGRELRSYFCTAAYIKKDQRWFNEPCSIFEMMIAFAAHAEFTTEMPLKNWFWQFMINLHLEDFRRVTGSDESRIRDILHVFVWRLYDENGDGGMFPLRRPQKDQRKVEIWYQFAEYLEDQGIF